MTFYIRHDGRMFKIESQVGFDLESGQDTKHLTQFSFEEIQHQPAWETDMEPHDEEFEP